MHQTDYQYIGILSSRFEQFKVKSTQPYRANMRCILCGDSKKSRSKARGWLLEQDGKLSYYCHNCGASMGFGWFIKTLDNNLYTQYLADRKFQSIEKPATTLETFTQPAPKFDHNPLKAIKKVSSLKADHPVKQYIEQRKIPSHQHYRLYYAPRFNSWVNSMIPGKLDAKYDEPRLVLPMLDSNGKMFGFSGRSFNPQNELRYITIMLDKSHSKMFGLDKVNFDEPYFVLEGQIDTLFLDNAVAITGASSDLRELRNLDNATFVFDNEPRNKDIVRLMEKTLDKGIKVCFWPESVKGKDVNEMCINGILPEDIQDIIEMNSSKGLAGKLRLTQWRKI